VSLELRQPSNILVVIAHPDDEVLGCGGAISKFVRQGHSVSVLLPLKRQDPRGIAEWPNLIRHLEGSCAILGAEAIILDPLMEETLVYSSLHLLHDMILPHVERADLVLSHWPGDVNQVHYGVSRVVEIATRPFRRNKSTLLFEIATTTEQGFRQTFSPNLHVVLEKEDVEKKLKAIDLYQCEIAPGRTTDAVKAKLVTRGAEIGAMYAEAFAVAHSYL
jgi:LmbE family N-acetylglucosaminyl deacetylase